jgi:hypothetical protein
LSSDKQASARQGANPKCVKSGQNA